ncbi:GpE family phage tail protein [Novosphingobium colocasiae]|uniref:GpE family phage tail protein n=1 Tax=Novosphingobium colocasiae TaxID=1256513 RepID=A0A918PFI8_9SPHN|nr:GpE family phage tail protein [Novosphingobium colocasiae]GGZ02612.1 hypothetical protein GCM10011614_17110 [Novosphingobium colocasiae]
MADLALIYHWSPAVLEALPVDELLAHHRRAMERWQASNRAVAAELARVLVG